jgi:hypothetical protein
VSSKVIYALVHQLTRRPSGSMSAIRPLDSVRFIPERFWRAGNTKRKTRATP